MINAWKCRKKQAIRLLSDFKRLFTDGRFYLAGQQMRTPHFFLEEKGTEEIFNEGCKSMGKLLLDRAYPTGTQCWEMVWEKQIDAQMLERQTKELIISSGDAFFEKSATAMAQRMSGYEEVFESEIQRYRNSYRADMKVVCPVGMLGGLLISIILI